VYSTCSLHNPLYCNAIIEVAFDCPGFCFPVTESCEWQRGLGYTTQKGFKVDKQSCLFITRVFRSTASGLMMRSPGRVTLNNIVSKCIGVS